MFLVNRERLMPTDSRFQAETSVLKRHLSAQNITAKSAERRGHKTITDHREQRALTSFEVCPVLDKEWLLIAMIDEDEVVTRAWNRQELEPMLLPPHINSAHGVIERLLEAGLFLSQITFVRDRGSHRADVLHDPAAGRTWVHWYAADGGDHWVAAAEVPDLGRLSQQALDYPDAVRRADTS